MDEFWVHTGQSISLLAAQDDGTNQEVVGDAGDPQMGTAPCFDGGRASGRGGRGLGKMLPRESIRLHRGLGGGSALDGRRPPPWHGHRGLERCEVPLVAEAHRRPASGVVWPGKVARRPTMAQEFGGGGHQAVHRVGGEARTWRGLGMVSSRRVDGQWFGPRGGRLRPPCGVGRPTARAPGGCLAMWLGGCAPSHASGIGRIHGGRRRVGGVGTAAGKASGKVDVRFKEPHCDRAFCGDVGGPKSTEGRVVDFCPMCPRPRSRGVCAVSYTHLTLPTKA